MEKGRLTKDIEPWRTLESEYLIRRPWLTARRDKLELPDGRTYDEYYILEYPDWVNVIAITREGKFILEQQWRHAEGRVSTEICAGVVEKGETPLQAAQRELQEETGFGCGTWTLMMTLSPNSSSMTNHCYTFLAEDVEQVSRQHLDRTEDLSVLFLTQEEVFDRLQAGEFHQALMAAPLWKYFYHISNDKR